MKSMLFISLFLFLCAHSQQIGNPIFPYQVNEPDQVLTMAEELKEISGLGLTEDGQYLVAVQDENGIIYYLDKNTGAIQQQIKFKDDGDFEGIEVVGKTTYVVKSTGTIYEVPENGQEVKKYNFELSSKNDVEGLAFDAKNNRLLLACKNKSGTDEEEVKVADNKRGIYAFDLDKKTLSEKPVYIITPQSVQDYLSALPNTSSKEKMLERFSEGDMKFAPSAIAVHPQSGNLYVLSAVGNILLVLDADGNVLQVEKLKKKIHLQPEGICFDKDGTMYISNEGRDGEPGKIFVFKEKNN